MKDLFLNRMAIADLADGTVECRPLPDAALASGDLSCLASAYADALILAAGRFTGSHAPAACLLTVHGNGKSCFLKAHCGVALRRCGVDALILRGKASQPSGLLFDGLHTLLEPMDRGADATTQRVALHGAARKHRGVCDADPVSMVTGPAAFAGCAAPALVLDTGTAPRSALAATWLAAHNVVGICLDGAWPCVSPLPLDNPARAAVQPSLLTAASLGAVLRATGRSATGAGLALGRSIACHACPAPCQCWLPAEQGFVACTSPEALALLLERGAAAAGIATVLCMAERYGVDPLGLATLVTAPSLPDGLQAVVAAAQAVEEPPASEAHQHEARRASLLGVCPFFLRRFPAVDKALDACGA